MSVSKTEILRETIRIVTAAVGVSSKEHMPIEYPNKIAEFIQAVYDKLLYISNTLDT